MANWKQTNAKFWRLSNLKNIRKQKGKTQEQVARDLGIPISTYRSWEQEKNSPTAERLAKLALYFECSADDFIVVGSRPNDVKLKMTEVPLLGEIAAGDPLEIDEYGCYESQIDEIPIPTVVYDKHPRAFLTKVVGDSMNRRIPNGYYALVDPDDREPDEHSAFAVCVNGDSATIKRVKKLSNGYELIPDSYDKTCLPIILDYNNEEDRKKTVTIIGKVVYAVMPFDFEI